MARRLILDTEVLIHAERISQGLTELIDDEDDVAIAAITLAELQFGVELADDPNRIGRQAFVDGVRALIPVEDYGAEAAGVHARLLAHVRREGKPRGAHDLIIAATAVATARTVVTRDAKAAFASLPGVNTLGWPT